MSAAKPVIVLVRPQLGQNIGKAARAMLNFGLTDMRLVTPRDGWPNPDAGPSASGADVVLEKAQLFDTVQEAIADCSTVYASTVRRRDLVMPVLSPETMAAEIAEGRIELDGKDLPAFCPNPAMTLWNQHPRVFLDLAVTGEAMCPYCGTRYRLKPGASVVQLDGAMSTAASAESWDSTISR